VRLAQCHPISCRCGQLRGAVAVGAKVTRAVCYCRDCQAFAASLGEPAGMLDSKGGTDVVATLPRYVFFMAGAERLACLSLTDRGLLRWYASCCRSPIGNTPRNPRISYVGLVHSCLGRDPRSLDAAFGTPDFFTFAQHAKGPVRSSGLRMATATVRIAGRLLGARLDGSWRQSPFFDSDLKPVSTPHPP
jgi:hypothetical protein